MFRRVITVRLHHIFIYNMSCCAYVRALNSFLLCSIRDTAACGRSVFHVRNGRFLLQVLTPALQKCIRSKAFRRLRRTLLRAFATCVANGKEVVTLANSLVCFVSGCSAALYHFSVVVNDLRRANRGTFCVLPCVANFYRSHHVCGNGQSVRRFNSHANG